MLTEAAAATFFTPAPHSPVLADAAAATVFTPAPSPLLLADAAAATVFTLAPSSLMLADAAAAAVFTPAPQSLVFADAAAATVFTRAPHSLVLADAAAATVFTLAPLSLVLADAAAAAVFTRAPLSLVLADAAAAAVFTRAPPSLVLAEFLDALLGYRRIEHLICVLGRCGCSVLRPFFLAALSARTLAVCALIRHPLRAPCSCPRAMRVAQHPPLRLHLGLVRRRTQWRVVRAHFLQPVVLGARRVAPSSVVESDVHGRFSEGQPLNELAVGTSKSKRTKTHARRAPY